MGQADREIAIRQQEKFDFYVISLVFTLLALSIQTADFGNSAVSDCLELLGWLALFISGISGLWRLESIPDFRMKSATQSDLLDMLGTLQKAQGEGEEELHVVETNSSQSIAERIENTQAGISVLTLTLKKLEKHNTIKYQTYRISFLVGLSCLLVARSYEPTNVIIAQILTC
jgi:hypothetical protein